MSQYSAYLQNQNYVTQIDDSITHSSKINATVVAIQTQEIQRAIQASSKENREAIEEAADIVCSELKSGFEDVVDGLDRINQGIDGLSDLVGHGFSLLIERQKITNTYLGKIQDLLRIPDSQKQRVYHIEEGMKYLKNAFNHGANSDFYTDALDEFKKAEAIQKKDFFSLYYIGYIYLKSPRHLDKMEAEIYFRNSARYYLAEASVMGTNTTNSLLRSHKNFVIEAAEAYLHAAEACYLQQKFREAADLSSEAWRIVPEMTKAGFLKAKYLAADNHVYEAVKVLEKVLRKRPYFAKHIPPDLDLVTKPEILRLLSSLEAEALKDAKMKYEECIGFMLADSIAKEYIRAIRRLIDVEKFLEARKAIDLLNVSKRWTINAGANMDSSGKIIPKITPLEFVGSVIEFVKFEKDRILGLSKARNLMRIQELKLQQSRLRGDISNLQSQIDEKTSELDEKWKQWGVWFLIWLTAFIIGVAIGNTTNGLVALLILALGLVVYGGGVYLVVTLFMYVIETLATIAQISPLKSRINQINFNIRDLDNEILLLE